MVFVQQVLGPFEIGQQPTITAVVKNLPGETEVSTDCTWTITDPNGVEEVFTSPDVSIGNPSDNVWELVMPVLTVAGIYHINCQSTAGLIAAHTQRLGVTDT